MSYRLLVPAATIFLTTLLILSAGSQDLDNVTDEEAVRTPRGVERMMFRRKRRQMNAKGYKNKKWFCNDGYFEDHTAAIYTDDFDCKKCTNCTALKKQTQQECESQHNAACGPCLSDFCQSEDICQPCPIVDYKSTMWISSPTTDPLKSGRASHNLSYRISKVEQCNTVCQTALGACGCLVIFGGALIFYYKKKKKLLSAGEKSHALPEFDTNIPGLGGNPNLGFGGQDPWGLSPRKRESHLRLFEDTSQGVELEDVQRKSSKDGNPAASFPEAAILLEKDHHSLLQGKKLYAIINAVPVRRWKEFVRGLGLRDDEIELVELDYSQFREQQYEMLKRWCQRQGASLDAVFTTLEEMALGGCAQELRAQLQPWHLQDIP